MLAEFIDLIFSLLTMLLSLLPSSFVRAWIDKIGAIEYLSYINYFIPFNIMADIGKAWLYCCGAYLIYYYVKTSYDNSTKK